MTLKDIMTRIGGDDLVAARRFTNLCHKHMSAMFSGTSSPIPDVVDALVDIQCHAKLMHARAIYRAAQNVIDDLTAKRSEHICAASVLCLQKLIKQYETGLDEIAPKSIPAKVIAQTVEAEVIKVPVSKTTTVEKTPLQKPKVKKTKKVRAEKKAARTNLVTDITRQKTAADTLRPLIRFAKEEEKTNLVALLKHAANDEVAVPPSLPVREKFDVIMPALTTQWLGLARRQDKSVSVSFAADETALNADILKGLQAQLRAAGEILIMGAIESPEIRTAKGLNQSAHLAITARSTRGGYKVLMSCEGILTAAVNAALLGASVSDIDARLVVLERDGTVRLEIVDIPDSIPPAISNLEVAS